VPFVGIFQATESNITCSHLIGAGPRFMYMEVISKYILAYLLLCNSLFVYLCGSLHRRMNVPVGILASLFSKCYVKNLLQLSTLLHTAHWPTQRLPSQRMHFIHNGNEVISYRV
jgi:hypothetical protein